MFFKKSFLAQAAWKQMVSHIWLGLQYVKPLSWVFALLRKAKTGSLRACIWVMVCVEKDEELDPLGENQLNENILWVCLTINVQL